MGVEGECLGVRIDDSGQRLSKPGRQRFEERPDLRKVSDLSFEKIRRELEFCGGDVDQLTRKLGVPSTLLARRLSASR
jgi:ActR/RegA family two-component response regulator